MLRVLGRHCLSPKLRAESWTRLLSSQSGPFVTETEEMQRKLNKLLYRSQQRGLLELDILLGKWAETELPKMDSRTLTAFEKFLEEETPSIFKWITGQEQYPQRLKNNHAFMNFYNHVQQRVMDNSSSDARNKTQAEWVRGWHDKGNQ